MYDGNVLDSQISDQIAVLNAAYKPMGFAFKLVKTTRTLNADWFANMKANSEQEGAAQNLLHVGGLNTVLIEQECVYGRTSVRSMMS
jgi:hypothetical protein